MGVGWGLEFHVWGLGAGVGVWGLGIQGWIWGIEFELGVRGLEITWEVLDGGADPGGQRRRGALRNLLTFCQLRCALYFSPYLSHPLGSVPNPSLSTLFVTMSLTLCTPVESRF